MPWKTIGSATINLASWNISLTVPPMNNWDESHTLATFGNLTISCGGSTVTANWAGRTLTHNALLGSPGGNINVYGTSTSWGFYVWSKGSLSENYNWGTGTGTADIAIDTTYVSSVKVNGGDIPIPPPETGCAFDIIGVTSVYENSGQSDVFHIKRHSIGDEGTTNYGLKFPASVTYSTSDFEAVAGIDYTATSGTLNFAVGVDTMSFSVPVINNHRTRPDGRKFYGNITGITSGIAGSYIRTPQATNAIFNPAPSYANDVITFDLKRRNVFALYMPPTKTGEPPLGSDHYHGSDGKDTTVYLGCKHKKRYIIIPINPKPFLVGVDEGPGNVSGYRDVYSDCNTKVRMKEYADITHPNGVYELEITIKNKDGTETKIIKDVTNTPLGTTNQLHNLKIIVDGTTVDVKIDDTVVHHGTLTGDGEGDDGTTTYIACPGPPKCQDQGFQGDIGKVLTGHDIVTDVTDPQTPTPGIPGDPNNPIVSSTFGVWFDLFKILGAGPGHLPSYDLFRRPVCSTVWPPTDPDDPNWHPPTPPTQQTPILYFDLLRRLGHPLKPETFMDLFRRTGLPINPEEDLLREIDGADIEVPVDTFR